MDKMTISSYNRITIDPEALEHNYRLVSGRLGPGVRVMAMVKSDAYGHGLVAASQAFARAGCTVFGVAEPGEGVELRESGCTGEIFILLGFEPSQVDYLFSHRLTPVVFTGEDLRLIAGAAGKRRRHIDLFLKFDCGMGRLGFDPAAAPRLMKEMAALEYVGLAGVMSHFPCADDRRSENTDEVYRSFCRTVRAFGSGTGVQRSICNSGGTLYHPEMQGDLVRVGIALYGYYPDGAAGRPGAGEPALRPAMEFATRVVQVKEVAAGCGISYGHTYVTTRPTRLAVLPVGYSDGYLRGLSNRAEVLINGRRAPVRGRICMNLCMADITEIGPVEPGDEAVLLGARGDEAIDADEIGGWCDTISYEILCSLGNNNDRRTIPKT